MQTIGGVFQCYKNARATYEVLKSFRNYYPTNTVVLLSDNGYDYTEMAKHFNCIYIHSTEHVPPSFEIVTPSTNIKQHSIKMYCSKEDFIIKVSRFIDRWINMVSLVTDDFIMVLEDDICIKNKITEILKYDLNGHCPNSYRNISINELAKKYDLDTTKKYHFSGHGGSIFKRDTLLECLQNKNMINDLLDNWLDYNFDELCSDFFLSLLLVLHGKTVGPYQGHNDNYAEVVEHQHKFWYGKELPVDLQYLVKYT